MWNIQTSQDLLVLFLLMPEANWYHLVCGTPWLLKVEDNLHLCMGKTQALTCQYLQLKQMGKWPRQDCQNAQYSHNCLPICRALSIPSARCYWSVVVFQSIWALLNLCRQLRHMVNRQRRGQQKGPLHSSSCTGCIFKILEMKQTSKRKGLFSLDDFF